MKHVFVSSESITWFSEVGVWQDEIRKHQRRDYEILDHASSLLEGKCSTDQRGDCINALNRVIDKRVKLLNKHYKIDQILKSKKSIDNLEKVGAAKRSMLLQVNRIRNFFEHQDRRPPKSAQLKLFVELVWYFLKATDVSAYFPRTEIYLSKDGIFYDKNENYILFSYRRRLTPTPWKVNLNLFPNVFSFTPIPGWIEFSFHSDKIKLITDPKTRLWAYDGRIVSKGYDHLILAKFLES
ncbi:MAG: hypothetical protein LBV12_09350 [Puniceicoccales bacterium]|jgi:hypothetical protein|nr:hypothetical protein [Puniceicoccales bacterium]